MLFVRSAVLVIIALTPAADSAAQSAENVALVVNEASADSLRIGEYYVQKRRIPASNVLRIRTSLEDQIDRRTFSESIEQPIAAALRRENLQDRVLYLVLTKGIPLRITGTEGRNGLTASVDSELALLYRSMLGRQVPLGGSVANPYFLGTRPISEARPFTHREHDIFLVTRLDGFSVDDVIALIDRAQSPSQEGRIVLDQRAGLTDTLGDTWLARAATRLRESGFGERVLLEETSRPVGDVDTVLGYYGWGSNDPQIRSRQVGAKFVDGAIAASFLSADARTFQQPPDDWTPAGNTPDRKAWFAGSPQSLTGDLILEGVTGVAGHVSEPFLDGAVRPEILFPAYLAGFNLAEAFYLAMPNLSWQSVIIGDPLCAPLRKTVLTHVAIEDPVDPETEAPGVFSRRRMEVIRAAMDVPEKAAALILRSETRRAHGDKAGSRQSLEQAVDLAPAGDGARLLLATLYDEDGEWERAVEQYRRLLEGQPKNLVALNNLAYALAVRRKVPEEALSYAEKAVKLAPTSPTILDTLAWIHHLLGNDKEAARLLTPAIQKSTGNAEIHLHAAIIYAAVGEITRASEQLKEALHLDPALQATNEVATLLTKLAVKRQ